MVGWIRLAVGCGLLAAAPAAAQGRLFAVQPVTPGLANYPGGGAAPMAVAPLGVEGNIHELDPETGEILNTFDPPVTPFGPDGLAFDGTSLWYVASPIESSPEGAITLWELDPDDGTVIDSDAVPSFFIDGVAALGGLVYLQDYDSDELLVFDPSTDLYLAPIDIGAANPLRDFTGGIDGFEAGGLLLAVAAPLAGAGPVPYLLVFLDPETGAEVDSFPLNGVFDAGIAAIGERIYTGELGPIVQGIDVFDPDGNLIDTFNVTIDISAMAGGEGQSILAIPAITPWGGFALALALAALAVVALRRRARLG